MCRDSPGMRSEDALGISEDAAKMKVFRAKKEILKKFGRK